jgi:hypothetical protein
LDKNEIAALLESLCDRPFADDPGRSPAMQDMAKRGALGLSHAATQQGVPSDAPDDPGRATAELAAILSGTATDAQCHEFQETATTSSAVRLDAQSALAFVDGIEQAPAPAPVHLVEQVLGSTGARALGTPDAQRRPGAWSRIAGIRLGVGRARMVAACALLIMAGGLSWSLLLPPANSPQIRMPLPAVTNPGGAPLSNLDPAPPAPVSAPVSAPILAPGSAPMPGPTAAPASAPLSAPMPARDQALADPCEPRSLARSEAATRSETAKRAPSPPPKKTADASVPDPACADANPRVVTTPAAEPPAGNAATAAGRTPQAARPASQLGGGDSPAAVLSSPRSAPPAARPASPAKPSQAIPPPR